VGVTRSPTHPWVAQQLREATPYGVRPKYLIHDNDGKFGSHFADVVARGGIEVLKMPYRAALANAVCERFLGSVRRECLDHILILSEGQLRRVLKEYVTYFNQGRPHQGIQQRVPEQPELPPMTADSGGSVIARPVLGGLHHEYRRAA
jgi:putative transposase